MLSPRVRDRSKVHQKLSRIVDRSIASTTGNNAKGVSKGIIYFNPRPRCPLKHSKNMDSIIYKSKTSISA